ncbi:maestro heat-like repeat-containing protein family member 1 isoform X3 [Microtus oregoni]|uniref:maestro heat-like repeat-containing protein family member 1 isoform X3 n=1 Tax=Microtus oregoni TaxID=111838 RepID=UPI001BB1D173|nr:maestro heat-like repeat-containing protein family member 1 isoform X3 [Microtus oregoni]
MTRPYVKKLSFTLLDSITDKDPVVQEQVCSALCSLGESQPGETLCACEEYLRQHDKLAHPYRTKILRAMETILSSHIDELDKDTAVIAILLASNEMTRIKELDCDWQQAASSVLVAVGKRFINQVMEEVLSRFQPGILPHSSVLHTLASLSVSNAFGMVPFLPSILSTMLPMLGMAKQDALRVVFCCALQHFSESTLEYLANLDQAPDPTVRKDTFAADIFGAYDILFYHWLQSRDAKLRLAVVAALGPMSHLLPSEKLEEQLPKLLPAVLGLYKKHAETFQISKSLGQILEAAVSVGSRTLEVQLDALLVALHAQICVPVESSSPLVMSSQKEVLRCFTVLACCSPDRLLAFLLPRLDTNNERLRVGTLQILRHIINSAAAQMEVKKPFILSSMRLPLLDTNNKVKRAVVQVISAMAHHGYLEQPGGEVMVNYIVQQCALPPEEPEKPGPDGEDLAADSVRAVSIRTLYLVSTTVDRMNSVLWPYLLEFLTPVRFTAALTPLCRSLVHLALKRQEAGADAFLVQYNSNANLPSPFAMTTRLLVVSSNPYLGDGRGAASLRLLKVMHRNIHPLLGQRWETTMPVLLEYLDEHTEETLSLKEWEEKLLMFLRDTLAVVSDNTWICQLSQEMCKQLPSYNGTAQEKNFLYKCIGTTLGAASSKEVVRKHLRELLETARYQEEAEQEGLACCFGICAITHLEDTLAQLEDFVRSDVFRKSIGIFNIFKVIAKRLPSDQLISLLLTMFESLGDPDKNCSRASTVMINCLLKERGTVLLEKVPEIVSVLRAKLRDTQEEHVLPAAQHSVYLLASQHCEAVVSSLLGSPLPFDSHTCALWRALAVEPSLTTQVLELLLEKMSRDVPFKESRAFLLGSTADRVATLLPLAATCALYEVLSAPSSGTVVLELYPQLFVALLLRVSCTVGVQLPRNLQGKERRSTSPTKPARNLDPCSSAVDALQALLLRGGSQDVLRCMEQEGGWELLRTSARHEDGVAQLASSMAKYAGPRLPLVMKALVCTQSSVYEIQRVTTTAFLAELLSSNVVNDLMLLEPLLDNLTARLKDSSASVRRLVLRGLANIASGSPDKVRAHGPQLMTAMVSGLDDGDEPHSLVALEAMVGLARLLDLVEPWDLRLVLLHTTIRIRPFFDSEKVEFRTASIRLFGHLNKACHGNCEDVFLEQVVGGLVPLLLHLRDPQASVASACKFALCMCVPHLECAELAAAFHKYLQEGRSVHFGEFLNSTCKHLMHHFPDLLGRLVSTNLFYFKSSWDDVRASAPMFTGFLVLHAEPEQKPQVDLEQLIAALQLLLKDPVPGVREKAAETLGRLVKFA